MHDFEYVSNHEWEPVRDELFEIIHRLQDEVRDNFTFQYHFVGSSKRKMITRDRNSNTGFDFDVNIEVNDPDENYSAEEIRNILHKGLDRVINPYRFYAQFKKTLNRPSRLCILTLTQKICSRCLSHFKKRLTKKKLPQAKCSQQFSFIGIIF